MGAREANVNRIRLDDVYIGPARRAVNDAAVKQIAASIKEIGLQHPITVRIVKHFCDPHEGDLENVAVLVAGRHRLEAVRALGDETIDCIYQQWDDLHAELAEIDENLCRSNLSPAQEAQAVDRRKAIYEELHPETKAGAARWNQNDNLSFSSATSEATGKDKRSIERAASRGEALGDDLDDIAGTSLDKGVELDALAKMPADERRALVDRAKGGEDVSARQTKIDGDIRNRAARDLAEWIVEHANGNDLDAVKANLFACGAKNIGIELTNLLGQSIMDRRYGNAA